MKHAITILSDELTRLKADDIINRRMVAHFYQEKIAPSDGTIKNMVETQQKIEETNNALLKVARFNKNNDWI